MTSDPYAQPTASVSETDRTWGAGAHLGSLLTAWFALGIIAPVVVLLVRGNQSAFARHHAFESLNFWVTTYLLGVVVFVVGVLTLSLGWVVFAVMPVWVVLFSVLAGLSAWRGEWYRYPLTLRFFKP